MTPRSRGTVFVDHKAEPGGDGSRKRPYRTLGEAMAANQSNKVQAYEVAPGRYDKHIVTPKPPKRRGHPKKKREPEDEGEL